MGLDKSSSSGVMPRVTVSHAAQSSCQSVSEGTGREAYSSGFVGYVIDAGESRWISIGTEKE